MHLNLCSGIGKVDKWTCLRKDGRDLVREWVDYKLNIGQNETFFVQTKNDLLSIKNAKNVLGKIHTWLYSKFMVLYTYFAFWQGIFSKSHFPFHDDKTEEQKNSIPTLEAMTSKAIQVLQQVHQIIT